MIEGAWYYIIDMKINMARSKITSSYIVLALQASGLHKFYFTISLNTVYYFAAEFLGYICWHIITMSGAWPEWHLNISFTEHEPLSLYRRWQTSRSEHTLFGNLCFASKLGQDTSQNICGLITKLIPPWPQSSLGWRLSLKL